MTDKFVDQLPDFVEAFEADDELVVWNASEADIDLQTQGSRWDHILAQLDLSFASNSELAAHKAAIPLDHADGSVTLAKLANMAADTIRMRSNTLGVPQDLQIGALPAEPAPGAGDVLLGQKGGVGALVKIDVSDISGGGGTPGGTVEGAIQIRNAAGDGFSAFDNVRVDAGKIVAIAANPTDVPFTVQGTSLQSGDLIKAKNDGDAVLFSVGADGTVVASNSISLTDGQTGSIAGMTSGFGLPGVSVRNVDNTAYGGFISQGAFMLHNPITDSSGGYMNAIATGYRVIVNRGDTGSIVSSNSAVYGWANTTLMPYNSANDTGLSRISAAAVAIGNGTQGDYSGTLKAANLILPSLPTADPLISGALWNDSGVVNISAG